MTPEQIDEKIKNTKEELKKLDKKDPDFLKKYSETTSMLLALSVEKQAIKYRGATNKELDSKEIECVKALLEIQARVSKGEKVEESEIQDASRELKIVQMVKNNRLAKALYGEKESLDEDIQKLEEKIKNFSQDGDKEELDSLKLELENMKKAKDARGRLEAMEVPETPEFIEKKKDIAESKESYNIKYVAKTGQYEISIRNGEQAVGKQIIDGQRSETFSKSDKQKLVREILKDDYDKVMTVKGELDNYDPMVIKILYDSMGIEAARKYVFEMSRGKDGKSEELPVNIEYDLTGLNETGLKRKQRKAITELAAASEDVAKVSGTKKSLWQKFVGIFKKDKTEALPEAKPEPTTQEPTMRKDIKVEPEDMVHEDGRPKVIDEEDLIK